MSLLKTETTMEDLDFAGIVSVAWFLVLIAILVGDKQ
jgi:hypothetical protein